METDGPQAAPSVGGLGQGEAPGRYLSRRRSSPSSPSRGPNAREAEAWVASASEAAVSTYATDSRSSTDPAAYWSASFDPVAYRAASLDPSSEWSASLDSGLGEEAADFSGASRPSSPRSLLAGQRALFYAWDHLGTVRIVTDASCQVVDRKDYEPYGVEIRPATNSAGNTHQYTGHERDEASGLDYMHYRYHAANLGRFMKPDNVPGDLTTPQSWNLYSYVGGNPVNFNDPTGHMADIPDSLKAHWNPMSLKAAFWDCSDPDETNRDKSHSTLGWNVSITRHSGPTIYTWDDATSTLNATATYYWTVSVTPASGSELGRTLAGILAARYAAWNGFKPWTLYSAPQFMVSAMTKPLTPQSPWSQNLSTAAAGATGVVAVYSVATTGAGATVISATSIISLPVAVPVLAVGAGSIAIGSVINMAIPDQVKEPTFDAIVQAGSATGDYFSSYVFTGP